MKKLTLVFFLLFSVIPNVFADPGDSYYNDGYAAMQRQDAKTAIEKFTKAIELNPNYKEAYYGRGYVYNQIGRLQEAAEDYSKVIELDPKDTKALYARASALQDMGALDEAIVDYNKLLELDPKEAKTYINNLGIVAHQKGEYGKAIEFFNKAIELDPSYIRPYYNRALSNSLLGKYAQANVDNAKVIEMDPKDASPLNNRGQNYLRMGEYDKAIADFNKAIEMYPIEKNPYHTPPYLGRAEAYFRQGKMDLGFAECENMIAKYPQYGGFYGIRALGFQLKKEYDKAWADVRKAMSLGERVPTDQLKDLRKETGLEPYDEEILVFNIKFIPPEGWKKYWRASREFGPVFSFYNQDNSDSLTIASPVPLSSTSRWISLFMAGATAVSKEKTTIAGLPADAQTFKITEGDDSLESKLYSIEKDGMNFIIVTSTHNKSLSDYAQDFDKALKQYEIFSNK